MEIRVLNGKQTTLGKSRDHRLCFLRNPMEVNAVLDCLDVLLFSDRSRRAMILKTS